MMHSTDKNDSKDINNATKDYYLLFSLSKNLVSKKKGKKRKEIKQHNCYQHWL